jgi:tetratricopeptide (TPR) repeat protein
MRGQLLGTPAYMAPEQALGRHDLVDQRTDIYSLGAILYEVITGRPPFVAPKTTEIIRKVCDEAPTPPRQIVPEIAPGLEAVCLKALRKDKADRYQLASELAQEVRRYLADEPVQAYAEPWTQQAWRWVRRNKVKVTAAAALLAATTVVLGITTPVIIGARNEAEAQGQRAHQAVHLLTKGADIAFDDHPDPVQREMLEGARASLEEFTRRSSKDPAVRLDQGWSYQQLGDLERKLGRLKESEADYGKAIATLGPLSGDARAGRQARRLLARTRTLLGDLLVRRGTDRGRAEPLYKQALEAQQVLADHKKDPAATAEDILRLGQIDKSRGHLLWLDAKHTEAAAAYDRAIAELEGALADDDKLAEARNDLALAIDERGWVHRDLGRLDDAEKDFRRAVEMLEKLVDEFPTVPRHREALARALNSLALIERETSRLDDAETHLRSELELAERLTRDFPDRTEYRRVLARTLSNLGVVLYEQRRPGAAEPVLARAVKVNTEVYDRSRDDLEIRFDLAKDRICLGDLLREKGDTKAAMKMLQEVRADCENLVKEHRDQPRYRELLAQDLVDLALATEESDQAKADELYRTADGLFDKLIADHPDLVDYRIGKARCLLNQGVALAVADRNEEAEVIYRRGLDVLDVKDARSGSLDGMRVRADLLTDLGDSQVDRVKRVKEGPHSRQAMALYESAESQIRRAMALYESLASGKGANPGDRHNLARTRVNLADCLFREKRAKDAEPIFDQAEASFERLVVAAPQSIVYHSELGFVQARKADLLKETGRLSDAAAVLAKAVGNQQRAVQLNESLTETRKRLRAHILALADVDLERGAYKEAAENALRIPRVVPNAERGEACLDAARVFARLVERVGGDPKLVPADQERRIRPYLRHSIALLHEAIDSDPKLAPRIKDDKDSKVLESRPEFKTMMDSLVDLGG